MSKPTQANAIQLVIALSVVNVERTLMAMILSAKRILKNLN